MERGYNEVKIQNLKPAAAELVGAAGSKHK
jgi:hypothetical protein